MANKNLKKCSPFLATKEMQIKTTVRFHLTRLNSYHQEHHQQQMLARMWGKRNPHILLMGMEAHKPLWKTILRILKK
jgi:hypothetical protein